MAQYQRFRHNCRRASRHDSIPSCTCSLRRILLHSQGKPNHLLSRFRADYDLPNTMNAYHEVLTLPLHNDLSLDDVHTVVDAVISLIRK